MSTLKYIRIKGCKDKRLSRYCRSMVGDIRPSDYRGIFELGSSTITRRA
jgi:hypothetical protein